MVTTPHVSGCLSCGAELAYLECAASMVCEGCGRTHQSNARCLAGHFFCDVCHSGETVEVIERLCLDSTQTDPVAITLSAMRHPKVKMHGAEHHYLAPAALLAAYCNQRGEPLERKASLLAEAKKRAAQVPGGTCGFWGACGAAIGSGIFVSLVTGATPRSKEPWALAQAMTSEVLGVYAKLGGPRCCKRNTWVATLAAAKFARQRLDTPMRAKGARCEFSALNPDCHKHECPFHPRPGPDADARALESLELALLGIEDEFFNAVALLVLGGEGRSVGHAHHLGALRFEVARHVLRQIRPGQGGAIGRHARTVTPKGGRGVTGGAPVEVFVRHRHRVR